MKPVSKTFKATTKYASLSIVQNADCVELRSDTNALHSVINIKNPQKLALRNLEYLMGVLLFIPAPQKILLLGTGGGSLIHFLRHHYPRSHLTSVDNDSELQDLIRQKMLLPEAGENLVYLIDDASRYLQHCEQQFDLILVDIFSGSQSPGWLLSSPAMRQLYKLLTDQGAVAYNLLVDSDHDFKLFFENLGQLFNQQILSLAVDGFENRLVYGFCNAPPRREMSYYIEHAIAMAEIQDIDYLSVLSTIYTTNPIGSSVIY
jgi:spermidine synthase